MKKSFALIFLFLFLPCAGIYSQTGDAGNTGGAQGGTQEITPEKESGLKGKKRKSLKSFSMGEIVISDKRIPVVEQASMTIKITDEDIKARSDKSLDEILGTVPGMVIETHTKGHVRARIRGFDQDKISILIDGIPVTDMFSNDIDLSNISSHNISKIVINRGVSSALYGSQGGVGSINIISSVPEDPFISSRMEYGQLNNYTMTFNTGAPINDFFFNLNGSIRNSDGETVSEELIKNKRKWFDRLIRYDLYPNPANSGNPYSFDDLSFPARDDYINDDGKLNHSSFRKYSLSGRFGYDNKTDFKYGIISWYNYADKKTNTFQNSCFSSHSIPDQEWTDPVFTVNQSTIKDAPLRNRSFVWPEVSDVNVMPYMQWEKGEFALKTNLFYSSRYARQEGYASNDHTYLKDTTVLGINEPYFDIKHYRSAGINLYPSYNFSSSDKITFALSWRNDTYTEEEQAISAESSPIIESTFGSSPYPVLFMDASLITVAVEGEFNFFHNRLGITAGISYDAQFLNKSKERTTAYEYSETYLIKDDSLFAGTRDSFNPVAGVVFDPVYNRLRLRLAGAVKTRFPTLSEYSKIGSEVFDYKLKPERIYSVNTGPEAFFNNRLLSLRADFFYTVVKNRIEKIPSTGEPPVNIERVDTGGIENSVSLKRITVSRLLDMSLSFSYVYLHARNHDDTESEKVNKGTLLELTPVHQFMGDLRLFFRNGTRVVIWGYAAFNQVMYAMGSRPGATDPYSTAYFDPVRVNDPVIFNIKVSHKIKEHSVIYFLCKNVADDFKADPFNPGPGRMFYAGLMLDI